jgi:murein L,D-transpeptidase YcbB/YkuD
MTIAAIKQFQKNKGLVVDGVAGRKTKSQLVKSLQQKMRKKF